MEKASQLFRTFAKKLNRRGAAAVLCGSALVLSLFLMLFNSFQGLMLQAVLQLNNEFVQQVDTISATSHDIIRNSAMQMFYSTPIKTLRTGSNLSNAQRIAGLRDLGSFVSSCTFLTSAMVYNPEMDYIFTSDSDRPSAPTEQFYDSRAADLLTNAAFSTVTVTPKYSSKAGDYYSFIFFEPNVPKSGAMLLNVRPDWYERQLLGISSGASCAILDASGNVLAAGSDELTHIAEAVWETIDWTDVEDTGGFFLEDNTSRGWMYCKLKNSGWYFLRSFDRRTILPALTNMRNLAFALLAAVCGLLIVGVCFTLIKLYRPFHAVRQSLKAAGESDKEVPQQVDMLLESQLEQRMQRQFERFFSGKEKPEAPAILIKTDTADARFLRERAPAGFKSIVAEIDFGCAALLFDVDETQAEEWCKRLSRESGCRCFLGRPRISAAELTDCRANLNELWQLRFLYQGQLLFHEKMLDDIPSAAAFHPKDAAPLISALHAAELDVARQCWRELFEKISRSRYSDLRFSIRYIFRSLNELYREISDEPLGLKPEMIETLDDVAELHRELNDAFVKITDAENARHMKRLNQLAAEINACIAKEYFDDSLSVQGIADKLGMNAVYIGRLFRKSTGMSIGEAINRARVENARQLLLQTDSPVESIARQVGFNNVKYFYVVFKGIEGTTPKRYRSEAAGG